MILENGKNLIHFRHFLLEKSFRFQPCIPSTETDGVSHNTLSVRPRISYQATNDSASEDELESTVFLTN